METESVTVGIVDSFDKWKSAILEGTPELEPEIKQDFENAEIIAKTCNLIHFMVAPVGVFNGKSVEARSRKTLAIDDAIRYFNSVCERGFQILLYQVRYLKNTNEWIIRFGQVDV